MPDDAHPPWCLLGPYAPCVLACGFLSGLKGGQAFGVGPQGLLPTTHYRLLHVEFGSLRLCTERLTLLAGSHLLLLPGIEMDLHLGRGGRLGHVLFDVTPSPRRVRSGRLVAQDDSRQPSPRHVWGVDLPVVLPSALNPQVRVHWVRIRALYWRGLGDQLRANAILASLLAELVAWKVGGSSTECDDDPAVRRSLDLGRQQMVQRLTCTDMAQTARLSPSRFRQRFRIREGLSPRDWLLQNRLLEAAHLLRESQKPVSEIGRLCGWTSPAAFSRAFATRYGMPPRQWRQQ